MNGERASNRNYDIVLFDAPPIIGVSDASAGSGGGGVLLVIQHRKYPASVSMRAKTCSKTWAQPRRVVLNNINISRDYSYYYLPSSITMPIRSGPARREDG